MKLKSFMFDLHANLCLCACQCFGSCCCCCCCGWCWRWWCSWRINVWQPERTFLICCNYMCFIWYYEKFVHYNFTLYSALYLYITYTHNPWLYKWLRLWALAATPLSLLFYLIKSLTLCNFPVGILFQWTQRDVDEVKTPRWGIKAYERAEHVFVAKAHSCSVQNKYGVSLNMAFAFSLVAGCGDPLSYTYTYFYT